MRSASDRFARHSLRMLAFLAMVAAFVALIMYAGLGIARVFPKRKVVQKVSRENVADPMGDDYLPYPDNDASGQMEGGSGILDGIQSSLLSYDDYNGKLRKAALGMGWEPDLVQDVLHGREIVTEDGDEWKTDDDPPAAPAAMSREVTLYNF